MSQIGRFLERSFAFNQEESTTPASTSISINNISSYIAYAQLAEILFGRTPADSAHLGTTHRLLHSVTCIRHTSNKSLIPRNCFRWFHPRGWLVQSPSFRLVLVVRRHRRYRYCPSSSVHALAPSPASLSGRAKVPASALALTNGWVLHFAQDDNRSIRLAASTSGLGATPISIAFSEFDNIPLDLVKAYDLPVIDDLKLDTILDVLENGHFKQYMFDASGHGCRFWIWSLLGFLKENGIITGEHRVDGARVCLQQVWTKDGQLAEDDQQTHLVPGKFVEIG
ncbi:hypothetical protein BDV97DRAFT_137774 [Delphinella strobiligena]|nr:hypothetical protein BDV97DRAFT_137774 [Delphinella strobiligena]